MVLWNILKWNKKSFHEFHYEALEKMKLSTFQRQAVTKLIEKKEI